MRQNRYWESLFWITVKFVSIVVAFVFCCLTEAEVQTLKCCWIKSFNDKITRAFWICSQTGFRYWCCSILLCLTSYSGFAKQTLVFLQFCSSAISFRLGALLPPFLHEIIPSLRMQWIFQILALSFPCPLLVSFLLTEYFLGLLIKISSLWTKIFVDPWLFPLCSSDTSWK